MSITDYILAFVPERFRRDVRFAALILAIAWLAFGFNARVADAEQKAHSAESKTEEIQKQVYDLQLTSGITNQKVSDINENVDRLVSAAIGPQAVVQHPTPPPPPIKPPPKQ